MKIGYIPILKGDISTERFHYAEQVGKWTYRMARLWMLVYLFSFIKLLRNVKLDTKFDLSDLSVGKYTWQFSADKISNVFEKFCR